MILPEESRPRRLKANDVRRNKVLKGSALLGVRGIYGSRRKHACASLRRARLLGRRNSAGRCAVNRRERGDPGTLAAPPGRKVSDLPPKVRGSAPRKKASVLPLRSHSPGLSRFTPTRVLTCRSVPSGSAFAAPGWSNRPGRSILPSPRPQRPPRRFRAGLTTRPAAQAGVPTEACPRRPRQHTASPPCSSRFPLLWSCRIPREPWKSAVTAASETIKSPNKES
ncbi:uncharacterized protein RHO17_010595 [Thomomys bottae]